MLGSFSWESDDMLIAKGEGEGYRKEGRYELNEIRGCEKGYGLYKNGGERFGDVIQEQRLMGFWFDPAERWALIYKAQEQNSQN